MGNKFPRPKDINFPEVQNKIEYNFKEISMIDGSKGKDLKQGLSVCLLKSGNILISYIYKDLKKLELKSCITIYTIPELRLVEKYIFDSEKEDITFMIDSAIQLENGNIFGIVDKLYIFDGENIKDGPKTTSEEIDDGVCKQEKIAFLDPDDIFQRKVIYKSGRTFQCDFMMELKEGIVVYTYKENYEIFLLDISKLETRGKLVYSKKFYQYDIIRKSEYYPDNLYIIGNNNGDYNAKNSVLLIFNLSDFCDKEKPKNPLCTISISDSQHVYGICEYDKKYLLADTIINGIYIIDMESRQKVAVSALQKITDKLGDPLLDTVGKVGDFFSKVSLEKKEILRKGEKRFEPVYRNIEKLKDGQVLIVYSEKDKSLGHCSNLNNFNIVNIREQTRRAFIPSSGKFILSGNYVISFYENMRLSVHQICDN